MNRNKANKKVSFFEEKDITYKPHNKDSKYNIITLSVISITTSLFLYSVYRAMNKN